MSDFDCFIMVDWSGGNDRGPKPKKDAIWIATARRGQTADAPVYMRNRQLAESWLHDTLLAETAAGRRTCVGFDFPFGYPQGFARALTNSDDPLLLWDWLAGRITDMPKANNRFDVAAGINARFQGVGPFWFNPLKRDIAHLPRKGRDRTANPFAEKRVIELREPTAFTLWQLAGAGAVGSQTLMGLPVLARLRAALPVSVWPFETLRTPIAFVEIWPSLLAPQVAARITDHPIKDAVQVTTMATAFANVSPSELALMLDVNAPVEGWILGHGHHATLAAALGRCA